MSDDSRRLNVEAREKVVYRVCISLHTSSECRQDAAHCNGTALSVTRFPESVRAHAGSACLPPCFPVETFTLHETRRADKRRRGVLARGNRGNRAARLQTDIDSRNLVPVSVLSKRRHQVSGFM